MRREPLRCWLGWPCQQRRGLPALLMPMPQEQQQLLKQLLPLQLLPGAPPGACHTAAPGPAGGLRPGCPRSALNACIGDIPCCCVCAPHVHDNLPTLCPAFLSPSSIDGGAGTACVLTGSASAPPMTLSRCARLAIMLGDQLRLLAQLRLLLCSLSHGEPAYLGT